VKTEKKTIELFGNLSFRTRSPEKTGNLPLYAANSAGLGSEPWIPEQIQLQVTPDR
jgi:hypothetical protein